MSTNKIKTVTLHSVNKHLSKIFRNQMHYNYKLDEDIFKKLIQRITLPTEPNKKIKLMYYNKFKTSNLVINNNSSPSIRVLPKKLTLFINLKVL